MPYVVSIVEVHLSFGHVFPSRCLVVVEYSPRQPAQLD
jgi:hypothetical protein